MGLATLDVDPWERAIMPNVKQDKGYAKPDMARSWHGHPHCFVDDELVFSQMKAYLLFFSLKLFFFSAIESYANFPWFSFLYYWCIHNGDVFYHFLLFLRLIFSWVIHDSRVVDVYILVIFLDFFYIWDWYFSRLLIEKWGRKQHCGISIFYWVYWLGIEKTTLWILSARELEPIGSKLSWYFVFSLIQFTY